MLGSLSSPVIDFCIGMLFFFFIMTMICTMINEYFMDKVGKLRQKNLLEGISGLFYDAQKVLDFYKHPLVTGLCRDKEAKIADIKLDSKKTYNPGKDKLDECTAPFKEILGTLPSYIPSRTFAAALLDILPKQERKKEQETVHQTVANLRQAVIACGNDKIKGALLPLINAAGNDVEKAQRNIERWFDDTMDRVGGWFKRHARGWLLVIGFVVCVLLNADTFMVGKILWQDPERLAALVTAAQKQADEGKKVIKQKDLDKLWGEINKKTSQLPIGWVGWKAEAGKEDRKEDLRQGPVEIKRKENGSLQGIKIHFCDWGLFTIIFKLLGLICTTLAISLGAPFWTDLLNTFVNLRRGGKKPAATAVESTAVERKQ
jgi:hypothetical protein